MSEVPLYVHSETREPVRGEGAKLRPDGKRRALTRVRGVAQLNGLHQPLALGHLLLSPLFQSLQLLWWRLIETKKSDWGEGAIGESLFSARLGGTQCG